MHDIKLTTQKHAPPSLAISMDKRIRQYGAEHIAHYGRFRATLDSTGRRHRASICPVSPRRTPQSSILEEKTSWALQNRCSKVIIQKAQNGPSTQLIESTS
jgi:hypothetical protein